MNTEHYQSYMTQETLMGPSSLHIPEELLCRYLCKTEINIIG
jgi:hypothetical protein